MWRTSLNTAINAPAEKVWKVLITPDLWREADPKHYVAISYPEPILEVGVKGTMRTQDSPGSFKFTVATVDYDTFEVVTVSKIPAGTLQITKRLATSDNITMLQEDVSATGPFSGLFARLFFKKQIEGTLADQHDAIKVYVEGNKTSTSKK